MFKEVTVSGAEETLKPAKPTTLVVKEWYELKKHDIDLIISYWMRCEEYMTKSDMDDEDSEVITLMIPTDLVGLIHTMTVPKLMFRFTQELKGEHTDPTAYSLTQGGLYAEKLRQEWKNILCEPIMSKPGVYSLMMHIECPSEERLSELYPSDTTSDQSIRRNYFYVGFLFDFPNGWIQNGCSLHQNNTQHPSRLQPYSKSDIRTAVAIESSVDIGLAIELGRKGEDSIVTFDCCGQRTRHKWRVDRLPVYVGYSGFQKGIVISLHPWDGHSELIRY